MTDPQVIVNLGTGGSDLNGRNGSTTSADSNDARFLDWPGDNAGNYVYLPGVDDNYLSVPDEAALDITGDIDVRVYVAADDWTPSSTIFPIGKSDSGDAAWFFRINTNGTLRFVWSTTGSSFISAISTAAPDVDDYEALWIRATLDVDNGAGGYDVKFYTSDDGSTWTQLGSTITGGSTTSIYASSQDLEIGSISDGATGGGAYKVHRAQVLDGIDGTMVLDVNTSVISSGSATSFTAVTGQTVTINRSTSGRKSVAVVSPVWLFGTDDYMEVADNALLDFDAADSFTVLAVMREWATPPSNAGIVSKRRSDAGYLLRQNGTNLNTRLVIDDATNSVAPAAGTAWSSGDLVIAGAVVDRDSEIAYNVYNGVTSSTNNTSSVGSLANDLALRVGRLGDTLTSYADFELIGVAVFRRVLTQAEIDSVVAYYQARLS